MGVIYFLPSFSYLGFLSRIWRPQTYSVGALHRCTAGNLARGYAGKWDFLLGGTAIADCRLPNYPKKPAQLSTCTKRFAFSAPGSSPVRQLPDWIRKQKRRKSRWGRKKTHS